MKSIRRRLTLWLLGGLALLWLAAGAGIYLAVRQGLLKSIDAELAVDARIVRFAARGEETADEESTVRAGARRLRDRMPSYHQTGSGVYFQMWNATGDTLERSESLGTLDLPRPSQGEGDPVFGTANLGDGRRVRTMSFQVSTGGRGPGKGKGRHGTGAAATVLAKDMTTVDQALSSLLGGLAIVGVMAAGGAVLWVGAALNRGLKPLRDLEKQTEAIDTTTLDIRFDPADAPAELRPVYERLNDLIHRLETGFDRERRFSSDLAHEMRTPVSELKMLSEVALKWPDQAGAGTHAETLEIALQLESTIESLLALARWESGEVPQKREAVDLRELALNCWEPFSKGAARNGITVRFETEPTSPALETDPAMLRHILGNLFSNAAEYTPPGETIRISIGSDGLEISNPAPDLSETNVSHLFERHWRADKARSDSRHSGLGLSLAKACAEALKFTLSAQLKDGILTFALASTSD